MNTIMKRQTLIILCLGIILALLPACKISGKVTKDGIGVKGATVVLNNGSEELSTTTDKNGEYAFSKMPAGEYSVTLRPPSGYSGKATRRVTKIYDDVDQADVNFSMDSETVRMISSGRVIGTRDENGVPVWWGIPFAAPPVGDLRWKAPVPPKVWGDNPYIAVSPGKLCVQYADMLNNSPIKYYGSVLGSEDCLYLNVWAPETTTSSKKPVMFWIHGGGNTLGEGSVYNGRMLAERYGVVVVTINYRLGPFGWFVHPALNTGGSAEDRSGNYGTLDIIKALSWVQENIGAFGGDKNNVMVFGESAGGLNTLTMLGSPLARGLFHKAAVQSGVLDWIAQHTAWQPKAIAENYIDDENPGMSRSSREVVNDLLIAKGRATDRAGAKAIQDSMATAELASFLRSLSASDIIKIYDYKTTRGGIIYMPTVIRDGTVIPDMEPFALFESGNYNQVPIIVGTNRDEYKLFLMIDPGYVYNIFDQLPVVLDHSDYEKSSHYYSQAWKASMADRLSTALIANQPDSVYTYRFDWDEEPNILGFDVAFLIGAAHGMEIPFVFADPEYTIIESKKTFLYTEANLEGRMAMADSMSSYWAAMAHFGAPGNGMPQAPQSTAWTPWNTDPMKLRLMIFDTPEDGGVGMSPYYLSMNDVRDELVAETGYSSELKCEVYHDIFGADGYYMETCME
ncbi:MAG: carboxylesterase family protein [Desulfobacteraceae bacterium]|jgi:para-nitrobenzyl esterase